MANRKIIWSRTAELDMFDIMYFYTERNKSKTYSNKLYQEINTKLRILDFKIALPQKTSVEGLFYFTHNHISVFFILELNIMTVKFIIDERRSPKKIKNLIK